MLYYSQAVCVSCSFFLSFHAFTCLYTYTCNHSTVLQPQILETVQVLSSMLYITMSGLGQARPMLIHGAMRKRHARAAYIAYLATQRNIHTVHWYWSLQSACMHSQICIQSQLARPLVRPASYDTRHHLHPHTMRVPHQASPRSAQSPLERLRTRHNVHSLAVLAITSRLCIAFVYMSIVAAAGVSQILACGCQVWRAPPSYGDNAGRGRKAEYTLQRYMNRLIHLKFSTVHVMASRVVYRFCLQLV